MPPKRKRRQRRAKPVEARDLKKEALAREIKLSAFNTDRYRRLWREILMRMTMPDIERKVQVAWQTLDHALDLKDYRISLLLDGLQETENQRRKADGAHAETIDRSLETHETRLKGVDAFFRENIKTAFADKIYDFENINYHRNKDEALLVKINLLVNLRNENAFTAARSNAISKVDAFAEDGKNERRLTAAQLQKQLEDLWDHLRTVFLDYRKSTEDRRRAYNAIRRKDETDRQMIIEQSLRISYLLEEIARYRDKINLYKSNVANELRDVVRESRFFQIAYREANEHFIFGRNNDKFRTMAMSRVYNNSVKHLKSLMVKAERILGCMQTCRKYETQDEKILPPVADHSVLLTESAKTEDDTFPFDLIADFTNLENFWRRLGLVKIIVEELRIERNRLVTRSYDLQNYVKRWFTNETYLTPTFDQAKCVREPY